MYIRQDFIKPIEIFYSYAHEDEAFREELEKHLRILQRQGYIVSWYDRMISAGKEWAGEIDAHLNTAHIILLLVSPDYMASDYCYETEMNRALERHNSEDARVIPIILRAVYWKDAPFRKLQVLPRDGIPVKEWFDRDKAFLNITQGIVAVIKEIWFQPIASANVPEELPVASYRTPGRIEGSFRQVRLVGHGKNRHYEFNGQQAGETVKVVLRKHIWFLVPPAFPLIGSILGLLIIGVLSAINPSLSSLWTFLEVIFGILILITGIYFLYNDLALWWVETYIITNKRIISWRGLFMPTSQITPLESIQQVAIHIKSLLANTLEYGDVVLFLAGGKTFTMEHIPSPRKVRDIIEILCLSEKQETKRLPE